MRCLFFTNDLIFGSRVTSAARDRGGVATMVGSQAALQSAMATGDVALVILDLTAAGCEPAVCVAAIRQAQPQPTVKIIAYAPHVMEMKLATASASGCDEVYTRGQFNNLLATLF